MEKKNLIGYIIELAQDITKETEIEVCDAEYVKEAGINYLRIYIDKENGVSTDDCAEISHLLSEALDKKDPIEEAYFLEVSSLGIDRPFKTDEDYEKNIGKEVEVKLYSKIGNRKFFVGKLISFNKEVVVIEENNEKIEIEKNKIIKINKSVEF